MSRISSSPIFDSLEGFAGETLVIGGDGRYFNAEAIQIAIRHRRRQRFWPHRRRPARLAVDARRLGADPVAGRLRRHHPVGEPQSRRPRRRFRHQIQYRRRRPRAGEDHRRDLRPHQDDHRNTRRSMRPTSTLGRLGETKVGEATVAIVDPVENYAKLMRKLFDFEAIRGMFASGFRMKFDAMHAITGPYAKAIFEERTRRRRRRRAQRRAAALLRRPPSRPQPDLCQGARTTSSWRRTGRISARPATATATATSSSGAASSSRPRIRWRCSPPTRTLAPGYAAGLKGVARSMPTSAAADRVAAKLGIALLRDADRLEVLRQPARRRYGDAVRRGKLRHRLQPHPREGRRVGGADVAQHSRQAQELGGRSRARALARPTGATITPATITTRSISPPAMR